MLVTASFQLAVALLAATGCAAIPPVAGPDSLDRLAFGGDPGAARDLCATIAAVEPQVERVTPARQRLAVRQARDAWLGEDKFRHFVASFAVVQYAYAGARALEVDRDAGLVVGLAAAVIAGVGKEIHDHRRGSGFSFRDLFWDAAGMVAAGALLRSVR